MQDQVQEDWLEARLRDEAPYLDDAGFTSRVVQKLPARHVRRSYRALILIGITVAASLIAYWLAGGNRLFVEGITYVTMMPVPMIWLSVAAGGFLVMGGGLAAAYSKSRGRSR